MHALLIDGLNLIRRVHAGVPGDSASSEHADTVVDACAGSLRRALRRHCPSHVLCALDSEDSTWRSDLSVDYKKNRRPMPAELHDLLPVIIDRFSQLGTTSVEIPSFEADDVIASVAERVAGAGGAVTILSTDKSFCQLLAPRIRVHDHFAECEHDRAWVLNRFEVEPAKLVDLFALAGDSSLGIPGIRSIGVHTAIKLLSDHGDLEGVLGAADQINGRLGAKVRSGVDAARLAAKLLALRRDVTLNSNLKEFRFDPAALRLY
jgi:5'-3' exonuclease